MMALRPHAAQTAAQVATKLAASAPKAEALLQQAHASLEVLEAAGARLVRQGLAGDAVPGRPALMAMALLGEHGRGDVLQALEPCWDDLCSKALAHGNLTDHPAPCCACCWLCSRPRSAWTTCRRDWPCSMHRRHLPACCVACDA